MCLHCTRALLRSRMQVSSHDPALSQVLGSAGFVGAVTWIIRVFAAVQARAHAPARRMLLALDGYFAVGEFCLRPSFPCSAPVCSAPCGLAPAAALPLRCLAPVHSAQFPSLECSHANIALTLSVLSVALFANTGEGLLILPSSGLAVAQSAFWIVYYNALGMLYVAFLIVAMR